MFLEATTLVAAPPSPPAAPKRPVAVTVHGDTRIDEYAWLRDRNDPAVIDYLEAENAYTQAAMAHAERLTKTLYEEIIGRIKQTDLTVPYREGAYLYYSRTVEGLNYPIYCRRPETPQSPEEIILDVNELARGRDYYRITGHEVSPDGRYLAYAADTTGYEAVSISIKDLTSGAVSEGLIQELLDPERPLLQIAAWGRLFLARAEVFVGEIQRHDQPPRAVPALIGEHFVFRVQQRHVADR